MALSTATITFDLADLLGVDFDARRTKVWVSTNIPDETVIDTAGNQIRLGSGKAVVNSDGTGSFTVWVPGTGANPASWQTYVHVDYVDAGDHRKGRRTRTFGPFTITVNADLADLVQQAVTPPAILGGDAYMATIDADGSSQFRQQQDARLPGTIAGVEAIVRRAPGVRYKPVVGVIRKSGGAWGTINDGSHAPTGIASITADTAKIRVTFDHTATKVGTFLCNVDETYAAEGYHIGASVALTHADLFIYKRQGPVGGYVTWDGANWTSSPAGMFSAFSFTGNTLYMEHASVKPAATNLMVSVVGRGVGNYLYRVGSISATVTRIEIFTLAGVAVTTPATDMKFYVMRGSDGLVAVDPTTMAEGSSNLWIVGQNEITNPTP